MACLLITTRSIEKGIKMGTRKALIFVSAALALLAFSIPASASALTLKDAGKEVNDK